MKNEFKKITRNNETVYVLENASAGATSAGAVATVESPLGMLQSRLQELKARVSVPTKKPRNPVGMGSTQGRGTKKHQTTDRKTSRDEKKIFEDYAPLIDIQDYQAKLQVLKQMLMDPDTARNKFLINKIRQRRAELEKQRAELEARLKKQSAPNKFGFREMDQDHEISMASNELTSIAKDAANLLNIVKQRSEEEGLEAWQQSKITKAADYMNSVLQSISGDEEQGVAEGLVGDVVVHNYTKMPINLKPGQAQIHGWGPNDQPIYRVKGHDGKEVITSNKKKMMIIAQGQGVAEGQQGITEDTLNEFSAFHGTFRPTISRFKPLSHFGTERAATERLNAVKSTTPSLSNADTGYIYQLDLGITAPGVVKDYYDIVDPGPSSMKKIAAWSKDLLKDTRFAAYTGKNPINGKPNDDGKHILQHFARMADSGHWAEYYPYTKFISIWINFLQDAGVDGLVYSNQVEHPRSKSYITFNPDQIKIIGKPKLVNLQSSEDNKGVAEGSDELYQKAIRKYTLRVAHDYLGGGNEHVYGANKFDSEMFGVDPKQAKQDFDRLFPEFVKKLQGGEQGVAEGSKIPMIKDPETGKKHPDYGNTGIMRDLAAAAQKRKPQPKPTEPNTNDFSKYNDFPETNRDPWHPVMIGEPSWANIPKSLEIWARKKGIHRDIDISHDPKGEIWTIKGKSGYPHDTEYTYRWEYDYDHNQFKPVEKSVAEAIRWSAIGRSSRTDPASDEPKPNDQSGPQYPRSSSNRPSSNYKFFVIIDDPKEIGDAQFFGLKSTNNPKVFGWPMSLPMIPHGSQPFGNDPGRLVDPKEKFKTGAWKKWTPKNESLDEGAYPEISDDEIKQLLYKHTGGGSVLDGKSLTKAVIGDIFSKLAKGDQNKLVNMHTDHRTVDAFSKRIFDIYLKIKSELGKNTFKRVGEQGVEEAHGNSKIYDKCWTGFRKVPGKKRGEEDSCKKIKKEDAYLERLNSKLNKIIKQ